MICRVYTNETRIVLLVVVAYYVPEKTAEIRVHRELHGRV